MIRKEILDKATEITTGDRQKNHGSPDDTFGTIASYWSAYLGYQITGEDVCHMMTLLKIARTQHGAINADDYVDAAGYQALAGEIAGANV